MTSPQQNRRHGATTVEMALVVPVVIMVLFGIFEYGRFLLVYQTLNNAAREGARYAVSRTDGTTTSAQVITVVNNKMAGVQNSLGSGYKVDVFYVDPAGLAQTPPVVTKNTTKTWDQADFGEKIAVQITGVYAPTMSYIVHAKTTVPFTVTSIMTSEGN